MRSTRGKLPDSTPRVKPIQRIELSENAPKKRLIIIVLLAALGLLLVGVSLARYLKPEKGWTVITPTAVSADTMAQELILQYDLGRGGNSSVRERKLLATLYTTACEDARRIFSADRGFEGVHNLYHINRHVGEEVTVPSALYSAFDQIERHGSRLLYAAPFYGDYENLFTSTEDVFAVQFDPYENPEQRAYFTQLSEYTGDSNAVRLELLGNNTVKLTVSPAYKTFADQNGISTFIDLYWARNAFAVDYIADILAEKGFTHGSLSSKNGFSRNLDISDTRYSYNIFVLHEDHVYNAARWDYAGKQSIVFLRTWAMYESDDMYYTYQNGQTRYPYIDPTDGLCKSHFTEIMGYSQNAGCGETLLSMLPAVFADSLQSAHLADMASHGIYTVYAQGTDIVHTEKNIVLSGLFHNETLSFTSKEQ